MDVIRRSPTDGLYSPCKDKTSPAGSPANNHEVITQPDTTLSDEWQEQTRNTLRVLHVPGVTITNYAIEPDLVEVWYCRDESATSTSTDEIRRQISDSLKLHATIELSFLELKRKPKFTQTAVAPGVQVSSSAETVRPIAAFVTIEGKGVLALLAAHRLRRGDEIGFSYGNHALGVVTLAYCKTKDLGTIDAALCTVRCGISDFVVGNPALDVKRCLYEEVRPPHRGMLVQKFSGNCVTTTGKIKLASFDSNTNPYAKCIAILYRNGETPFHERGESGTLVTTVPNEERPEGGDEIVYPIGMLIGTEFIERTDDGRGEHYSIAVPLQRTLEKLSTKDYCNNKPVRILGRRN